MEEVYGMPFNMVLIQFDVSYGQYSGVIKSFSFLCYNLILTLAVGGFRD